MQFVGNKNDIYESELPAFGQFPALKVADFQRLYHFMANETEPALLNKLALSRVSVNAELKGVLSQFDDLGAYSLAKFGDDITAPALYQEAVFAFAASMVIGVQISNDSTSEAAGRQDALSDKKDHCLSQYRRALDLLINQRETLTFEVL